MVKELGGSLRGRLTTETGENVCKKGILGSRAGEAKETSSGAGRLFEETQARGTRERNRGSWCYNPIVRRGRGGGGEKKLHTKTVTTLARNRGRRGKKGETKDRLILDISGRH